MSTIHDTITSNTLQMQAGQFGIKVAEAGTLPDLSTLDPPEFFYGVVKALSDSVLTLKVRASVYMGDKNIAGYQLKTGDVISGKFDQITVTSGKVVVYYGKEEKAV